MILRKLSLKGVSTAFRNPVDVDFDRLPPGLICLVGDNGQGKTSFMESIPAALFCEFPSYKEAFKDHLAPSVPDPFIDLRFDVGGDHYRVRRQFDATFRNGKGKTDVLLYKNDSPLAGSTEFAAALAKILPASDFFYAGPFACQGGTGSFWQLKPAERKDMVVGMLGLGGMQVLSEQARERDQKVLAALDTLRLQMADVRRRDERRGEVLAAMAALSPDIVNAEMAVAQAEEALDRRRSDLTRVRERLARAEAERKAIVDHRQRLEEAQTMTAAEIARLEERIASLNGTLAERDAILTAGDRLEQTLAELAKEQAAERKWTAALRPVTEQVATLTTTLANLKAEYLRLWREQDAARAALERSAGYDAAQAEVNKLVNEMEQLAATVIAAEERAAELDAEAEVEADVVRKRQTLEARIADLTPRTALLTQVDLSLDCCTVCPLTADARTAGGTLAKCKADLRQLPPVSDRILQAKLAHATKLRELRTMQRPLQASIDNARGRLRTLEADRTAGARHPELSTLVAANVEKGRTAKESLSVATAERDKLERCAEGHANERLRLEEERDNLRPTADKKADLAAAEAQHAEVSAALTQTHATAADLAAQLAALPPEPVTEGSQPRAEAEDQVVQAQATATARATALRELINTHARHQGELAALGDPAAELEAMTVRETQLSTDAGDWTLLEKALGRQGAQALCLDNAGPHVTGIANDLLASCYGTRFAIAIDTAVEKKDGKGQKEVFDIRILDAEAGADATRRRGSGGEMVIIEESLRLALAIYNTQQSGFEIKTLFRDETAGALSEGNADRYVLMLKRAREIGRFHQILFIAHQPHVFAQADERLYFADGKVKIGAPAVELQAELSQAA